MIRKLTLLALLIINLQACNSKKDAPAPEEPTLVGTWDVVKTDADEYDLNWVFVRNYVRTNTDPNDPILIRSEFLIDGTFREYEKNNLKFVGNYSRNGNKLIINISGMDHIRNVVSLTQNEFVLKDTTHDSSSNEIMTVTFKRHQ